MSLPFMDFMWRFAIGFTSNEIIWHLNINLPFPSFGKYSGDTSTWVVLGVLQITRITYCIFLKSHPPQDLAMENMVY